MTGMSAVRERTLVQSGLWSGRASTDCNGMLSDASLTACSHAKSSSSCVAQMPKRSRSMTWLSLDQTIRSRAAAGKRGGHSPDDSSGCSTTLSAVTSPPWRDRRCCSHRLACAFFSNTLFERSATYSSPPRRAIHLISEGLPFCRSHKAALQTADSSCIAKLGETCCTAVQGQTQMESYQSARHHLELQGRI